MAAQDIRTDESGFVFENGDFAIFESDQNHIQDIIESLTGDWKEFPLCGVGLPNYLGSSGQQQIVQKNIQLQLQADGYEVIEVLAEQNTNGTFNLEVNAERI